MMAARAAAEIHRAGSRVGRYEIRGVVGKGGMGVVYVAHDPQLDRRVALKTVRPDQARPKSHERLLRGDLVESGSARVDLALGQQADLDRVEILIDVDPEHAVLPFDSQGGVGSARGTRAG